MAAAVAAAAPAPALGAARLGPCLSALLLLWLLPVMMHQAKTVWALVYACYDAAAAL